METENTDFSNKGFLHQLEKHFGPYELKGSSFVFQNYENRVIAKKLLIDPGYFSKLLKEAQKDEKVSYRLEIEKILQFADAKAYREYKPLIRIYKWSIGILLFVVISLFILLLLPTPKPIETVPTKKDEIFLGEAPSFREVITIQGLIGMTQMKLDGVLSALDYRTQFNEYTREDTIQIIQDIRRSTRSTISASRRAFKVLKFMLPSGTSVMDSLEKKFPIRSGRKPLYKCSDEDFIGIRSGEDLPDYKTPYDKGIGDALPFILEKRMTYRTLAEKIEEIIVEIQDDMYPVLDPSHPIDD